MSRNTEDATGTFDDPRGRESEVLAYRAERAESIGLRAEAVELFRKAAELEEAVVVDVPASQPRIRRILAMSTLALWVRAGLHDHASSLALDYIASGILTEEDLGEMSDRMVRDALRDDEKPWKPS
jgi:hypothetical protein